MKTCSGLLLTTTVFQDKQPSEDSLQRLPPESRNVTYRLVLVDDPGPTLFKNKVLVRYGRWRGWRDTRDSRHLRWHEPALLRASKWLRKEAKFLYYTSHKFSVGFSTAEVEPLCRWLRSLVSDMDNMSLLSNFDFGIPVVSWQPMLSWFALAELARDLDAEDIPVTFDIPRSPRDMLLGLVQVAQLGVEANKKGWKMEYRLRVEFEKWAGNMVAKSSPVVRADIRHEVKLGIWLARLERAGRKPAPSEYHCKHYKSGKFASRLDTPAAEEGST